MPSPLAPLPVSPRDGGDPPYKFLSREGAEALRVISRVMLDGCPEFGAHEGEELVLAIDALIARLPEATQTELRQLLGLLGSRLFMALTGGLWQGWERAEPAAIEAFLERWRQRALLPQLRAAYQALQELVMAAWYSQDKAWSALAYSGPPPLRR